MALQNQIEVLALCYCLLFLLCLWTWKMKSENLVSQKVLNGNWLLLHVRHAGGILIMTGLPMLFLPVVPGRVFLWPGSADNIQTLTLMITGLMLLILVIKNRESLPIEEPVSQEGSSFHAILHIFLRSSFLVSYECFFRGFVLFSCIDLFGAIPAIIINLVLYALIHSFNGKKEMYGSVPFGLMLCVFTIWYQSVWPAILLHLLLSSSHESFFLSPFLCKRIKPVL
jgi:membrane protease YdiL (CAAX protease family)